MAYALGPSNRQRLMQIAPLGQQQHGACGCGSLLAMAARVARTRLGQGRTRWVIPNGSLASAAAYECRGVGASLAPLQLSQQLNVSLQLPMCYLCSHQAAHQRV